ncbi:hypothetical protein HAX54_007116 [Datura stramonium]|uniref:Uncharacterized protein n=1 Tax=Datura stramonium TaxID=4076 RepID=A0ABS8TCR1_DATST|nr:hypothetical protein [Datura stramonium]
MITRTGKWLVIDKKRSSHRRTRKEVKTQMAELQSDYSELQQEYEKVNNQHRSSWTSGWRKMKKSGLFNRKMVEDEAQEGKHRVKPGHRRQHQKAIHTLDIFTSKETDVHNNVPVMR